VVIGSCNLAALSSDSLPTFCPCRITGGTGRFAGASLPEFGYVNIDGRPVGFSFQFVSSTLVEESLLFNAPVLGANLLSQGSLNAVMSSVQDSACASGIRNEIRLTGPLPHLGKTSGLLSYCRP
jgi:hypothetical protein